MNVILVGYRGTGKTAVGALLAREMGLALVSLDAEIIREAGTKIPQIVEERGWPGFRDLEEKIVHRFAAQDGQIIDCGGGVIEREANIKVLQGAGPVIWLKASTQSVVNRIGGDDQRPSLTGVQSFTDEVEEVLKRRTPIYRRIAHHEVDTDHRTIEEVASRICRFVSPDG